MEDPLKHGLTSIMNLPDDCLSLIFQFLDCSSDRNSFGLTCRRWLQIQNLSRQYLQFGCSFFIQDLPSLSQPRASVDCFHLYRLLTRFWNLRSLNLSGWTELPDSGLAQLRSYGSNLQSLHLDCCFGVSDDGISFIADGCPSLTFISLYRCHISDIGLETLAKSCLSLKDVNLSYCLLISDCGIRALSKYCRQLQAVRISYCRNINGVGFKGCSQTLAYLEADGCKLDPEGIMGIVSGRGLEYFDVSSLSWSVHGDGLSALGAGFAAKLSILNLRLCRTISDASVIAIAMGCPLLREWNLALCHEVKISGWESIGVNCHNLEIIHVNRCRGLCDYGFQALRDGCKRLSVLYMSRNSYRMTSTAIELFKSLRRDVEIKEEERLCIRPKSIFT